MPAVSKAQKKLFQLALAVKKGLVDAATVDSKIKELAKKSDQELKDYAETPEESLPNKVEENAPMATPASVNGMGDVSLPGNPGTQDSFSTQETGSGDLASTSALTDGDEKTKKKKGKDMYKFLKYNAFVGEMLINESMIPTLRDVNKMSKDQLIRIQGILFGRSDQKKILNAIRKRLEQIDESVNEGKDKWVVYDIETKKRLPNPGKSWATMKAAQAFADKQKNADVASDIWYFDKIKESLNEGPDYSEASFQMDKIFGDDQESIEIFQDIEDNGTVEDMIDYIENYGDEDQLQRYGIRSAAHVKKFAQHIMRKR